MGVHSVSGFAPMALDSAGMASGQAFLGAELEKRDPRLLEPLMSTTWMRDIVAETGGGYVDFVANYFVDYATSGANQYGIIAGQTNNIPILQANVSKDVFRVFTWANNLKVPFLDQQRMSQIGRSLDQLLDDGLRINYEKTMDKMVYQGMSEYGTYGLVNNPNVASGFAATGAASSKLWANKTADEILTDVDTLLETTWTNSQYDVTGMANHILVDPVNFALLNRKIVSSAGNISVLNYLKQNNIAAAQGQSFEIFPSRWCLGAGLPLTSGGAATNRMVAYVNRKDRVSIDVPVPLTRAMTMPDVNQLAYLTAYISLISEVKFLYFQCAEYLDGI